MDLTVASSEACRCLGLWRSRRAHRVATLTRNEKLIRSIAERTESQIEHARPAALFHGGFDSAVALLEFASYPQILAAEAMAVLQDAECVESTALVARTETSLRVLQVRGWDERQALQAAKKSEPAATIDCGTYRDEACEIVAALRRRPRDRCTGVAIRKLVDTGVTLDRYRRDEKQRAALWPAEVARRRSRLPLGLRADRRAASASPGASAPTPLSVLLTGETGTGKEMLARTIHRASTARRQDLRCPSTAPRCHATCSRASCSAIARARSPAPTPSFAGVIRAAEGGTLFLDEIADIAARPPAQAASLSRDPRGPPARRAAAGQGRRPRHRRHQRQPRTARRARDASARTSSTASTSSGCGCRRCASGARRSRRWSITTSGAIAEQQKKGRLALSDEALEYLRALPLAGQRPAAGERNEPHRRDGGTRRPSRRRSCRQRSRRRAARRGCGRAGPELRVRLDQPLNDAVDASNGSMVQARAPPRERTIRKRREVAGDLAKGTVPQTPPLGAPARFVRQSAK